MHPQEPPKVASPARQRVGISLNASPRASTYKCLQAPKRASEVEEDAGAPAKKRARVDNSPSESTAAVMNAGAYINAISDPQFSCIPPTNSTTATSSFDDSLWWETSAERFAQSFLNDSTGEASSSTSGSIPLDYAPLLPESLIGEAPQLSWEELKEILFSNPTEEQSSTTEGAKAPLNAFDLFLRGEELPPEAEDQNRP